MGAQSQGKRKTRRKRTGSAAPAGERIEAPAPASGGGQNAKVKVQNPRHGTIAFTLKTTPQASCGAYIENAPRGFLPQGAWLLYGFICCIFSCGCKRLCRSGQRPLQAVPQSRGRYCCRRRLPERWYRPLDLLILFQR